MHSRMDKPQQTDAWISLCEDTLLFLYLSFMSNFMMVSLFLKTAINTNQIPYNKKKCQGFEKKVLEIFMHLLKSAAYSVYFY